MQSIEVRLGVRAYPVLVGSGLLNDRTLWDHHVGEAPAVIVSDRTVAPLYLDELAGALSGRVLDAVILPDGEASKTMANWSLILDRLAQCGAGRDACLVALGGGVVGDICGFAAATWMRGVDFVQVPTTLLAQVDASVGGKTAINHPAGKNLVGAFHQPRAVFADTGTLATLPDREFLAGLAEVVKYGAILDAAFIDWLEARSADLAGRDPQAIGEAVAASVRYKAGVVARDELEAGERAILNFGHSFAHSLETLTAYQALLHGEAVAMGMMAAARLSEIEGLCTPGFADRLRDLLESLSLPVRIPAEHATEAILDAMRLDKKNRAGVRRLVLLEAPGQAVIRDAGDADAIRRAIDACR